MTTMKKKNYISPVVEMLDIKKPTLLAGSVTDSFDIAVDNPISGSLPLNLPVLHLTARRTA